jgi:hypothetical protein
VSAVDLVEGDALSVAVERAGGTRCERCWTYAVDAAGTPPVCPRCAAVVGAS